MPILTMSIDRVELTESDLVEEILCKLNEEDSYPKQIAQDTDSHPNTVSDYIAFLRKNDLVKRSKRTKAQYYCITDKGKEFLESLKETKSEIQNLRKELCEVYTS